MFDISWILVLGEFLEVGFVILGQGAGIITSLKNPLPWNCVSGKDLSDRFLLNCNQIEGIWYFWGYD